VTLEIGGAVETYWKSLAVPHTAPAPVAKTATPRLSRARQLGSAQLGSPTGSPITVSSKAQPITISSITGSYVYITVQVTQDLQPVVFGEWQLPQQDFDLWVADVTLAQFEALARRKGRELRANNTSSGVTASTPSEWHSLIRRSMVSLENLLKVRETSYISSSVVHWATKTDYYRLHTHMRLRSWSWPGPGGTRFIVSLNFILSLSLPKKNNTHTHSLTPHGHLSHKKKYHYKTIPASMGLCLELAYPITSYSESRDDPMDSAPFRHQLPLNSFIDSILRTVYHASAPAPPPPTDPHGARRQIIFTSSSPDACAAVNWKQPNCQSRLPISISLFLSSLSSPFRNPALQSEIK
jgi:hypothetical protein